MQSSKTKPTSTEFAFPEARMCTVWPQLSEYVARMCALHRYKTGKLL